MVRLVVDENTAPATGSTDMDIYTLTKDGRHEAILSSCHAVLQQEDEEINAIPAR